MAMQYLKDLLIIIKGGNYNDSERVTNYSEGVTNRGYKEGYLGTAPVIDRLLGRTLSWSTLCS
jgi:hypothetical protein